MVTDMEVKKALTPWIVCFVLLFSVAPVLTATDDVSVTIRFYEKEVYYPDSNIRIEVTVGNDSSENYRFRLADRRLFNLEFDVRTLTNRQLPVSEQFIIQRTANQQVFYREITVAPGEKFSFVENLGSYVQLSEAGVYVIQADFFPELAGGTNRSNGSAMSSNRLTLSVRPGTAEAPQAEHRVEEMMLEVLRQEAMPPDEVVRYVLDARRRGSWNQFFLYLDLESLLQSNPDSQRRYQRLSDEDRRDMLNSFRRDLQQERADEDILLVPDSYSVLETSYAENRGTVVTEQRFRFDNYVEIKRYTYNLERRDDIWLITEYTVRNMGAE